MAQHRLVAPVDPQPYYKHTHGGQDPQHSPLMLLGRVLAVDLRELLQLLHTP